MLLSTVVLYGCGENDATKKSLSPAEESRLEESRSQVEQRVQEQIAKENRIKAELDSARGSAGLKDWSFQVTSSVYGLHINDGPVVFIKYTVTNNTKYWLKNAKWNLSLSDERGKRLGEFKLQSFHTGGLNHVRPGEIKKDDFILGYKDIGFSPRLVEAAGLVLSDFELTPEMPAGEKAIADELERQRQAGVEASKKAAEAKRQGKLYTDTKVFEFYRQQATNGDGFAQLRLGECFLNGQGTETNLEAAIEWLQKAAAKGNHEASNKLATLSR